MMHAPLQRREPSRSAAHQAARPFVQPKLMIGASGDRLESEADRAADAVVNGAPVRIGAASSGAVRRDSPAAPPQAGGYSEAGQKLGEAFLKTQVGKQLVEAAERLGTDFISTLPGKIITGAAAVAAVGELAREHKALPAQPPAVPLDFIAQGLKAQVRVEGPIDHPSAASISFSIPLGRPAAPAKPVDKSAAYRAETERMRADLDVGRPAQPADPAMEAYNREKMQEMSARLLPGLRARPAAAPPEKKDDAAIQRKADSGGGSFAAPDAVEGVLAAGGAPLPQAVRSSMSARFGYDFSGVKVHADDRAAASAAAIGARAYTYGDHIVFGRGQYAAVRREGQWLLAHELAHVAQQSPLPTARRSRIVVGRADEPMEHEADRVADDMMRMPAATVSLSAAPPRISRKCEACEEEEKSETLHAKRATSTNDSMPREAPEIVHDVLRSPGHPLDSTVRTFFEPRFGADLSRVRLHTDVSAAESADAIGAHAFAYQNHIAFAAGRYDPNSTGGKRLLAHELAHVEQARGSGSTLRRQPKADAPSQEEQGQKTVRLHVESTGMDDAARLLASNLTRGADDKRNNVFIGLSPTFIKVYDPTGKTIGRIALKPVKGLRFIPGVYLDGPKGMAAVTVSKDNKLGVEQPGSSKVLQRPYTAEEKEAIAEEAKKAEAEGRQPKPARVPVLNLVEMLTEPDRLGPMIASVPNAFPVYFVPSYLPSTSSGKGGGETKGIYSSPIEGRADGQPANAPPWPVKVDGPQLAPINSDPTYAAKVDWSANQNYTVTSQAISQIGETIHYQWELFDITDYAQKQLAKDPAGTKAESKPEKTLDERIAEFKTSKAGTDVTGMGGANREFSREFEDWWKDTKRARSGATNPNGDTVGERLSHQAANELTLQLAPVSLLITALGAVSRWVADLFAGPRQQQEVPLKTKGIYLVRVITTPGINEDREGNKIIRPPSVDAKVVEVTPMDRAVQESLDEPGAQLAELKAQIDLAEKQGNKAKAEYLRTLEAEAKLRFEGSPLTLLTQKRDQKQKELDDFRKQYPTLSDYSRAHEVSMLNDQIALYEHHQKQLGPAGDPLKRVNASLISEVTGEQYPLLISAAPMSMENGRHRWMISDVTNRDGDAFIGLGDTPSAAFVSALTQFGAKAAYGRGRIGVRTAGLGLEKAAKAEYLVDSAPADWALAEKRIDDLVTTLAALGLIVASAGTAGAVIGAAVAAARLIQRWKAGKLYLDAQTVSDVLGVLGGIGAVGGQIAGGLRIQKFEKVFTILQEGKVTETELAAATQALRTATQIAKGVELANEVIGYAGLLWGDVAFVDQMMSISDQEQSGSMTHAAARRARAAAISSAVQNNGLFIAGNVAKAKQATPKGKAGGPGERTTAGGPGEKTTAGATPADTTPAGTTPADRTTSGAPPADQTSAGSPRVEAATKGATAETPRDSTADPHATTPKPGEVPAERGNADNEMARLGKMDPDSEAKIRADEQLRKALAEEPLAMAALKKCNSACFPPEMTAPQVKRMGEILRRIADTGSYNEAALKEYLYKRRDSLDSAITNIAGTKNARDFNAWLEFYNSGRNAERLPPKEDPAILNAMRERAHDAGVAKGRDAATAGGKRAAGFQNPFEHIGRYGQGFDDIMVAGMNLDTGDIYIVEYKGGDAQLAEGQMSLEWVIGNIRRLNNEGGPNGEAWARILTKALREGRLKGVVYYTEMEGNAPLATRQEDHGTYKLAAGVKL